MPLRRGAPPMKNPIGKPKPGTASDMMDAETDSPNAMPATMGKRVPGAAVGPKRRPLKFAK